MSDLLLFDSFSLAAQGPTLTLELRAGDILGVCGPPNSGKSRILRAIRGDAKPGQGRINASGRICNADDSMFGRRPTPLSIAKRAAGQNTQAAASAIGVLGLWDVRQSQLTQLSDLQNSLCELLPLLAGDEPVLVVDRLLDTVDPWTLHRLLPAFYGRLNAGACLVFSSSRPDLLQLASWLIVLDDQHVRFAGSPEDAIRMHLPTEIEVVTKRQEGVRALVEPFEVSMRETPQGLVLEAAEGQALASKLLLEGYGDVKMLIQRKPALADALLKITR